MDQYIRSLVKHSRGLCIKVRDSCGFIYLLHLHHYLNTFLYNNYRKNKSWRKVSIEWKKTRRRQAAFRVPHLTDVNSTARRATCHLKRVVARRTTRVVIKPLCVDRRCTAVRGEEGSLRGTKPLQSVSNYVCLHFTMKPKGFLQFIFICKIKCRSSNSSTYEKHFIWLIRTQIFIYNGGESEPYNSFDIYRFFFYTSTENTKLQ